MFISTLIYLKSPTFGFPRGYGWRRLVCHSSLCHSPANLPSHLTSVRLPIDSVPAVTWRWSLEHDHNRCGFISTTGRLAVRRLIQFWLFLDFAFIFPDVADWMSRLHNTLSWQFPTLQPPCSQSPCKLHLSNFIMQPLPSIPPCILTWVQLH